MEEVILRERPAKVVIGLATTWPYRLCREHMASAQPGTRKFSVRATLGGRQIAFSRGRRAVAGGGLAFHDAPCHGSGTSILEPRRTRKRRALLYLPGRTTS
jgi:hypothetical protein